MDKVARKHQLTVARKTLKMPPAVLGVIGGMGYAEAYRLVFNADLIARCRALVAEYGTKAAQCFDDGGVCWELSKYGWTPAEMLAQLGKA